MTKRLLFGVFMLAAACPPLARAGGAIFRIVAPAATFSIPAVPPASAPLTGALVPILSAAPSLSLAPLPAAAAAPVPVPASPSGMEAMMLRDLARERAQRAEEPPASALDEAKALAARETADGRVPWINEALLLRDLRRDEPRRRAIMKEQELYRESMARAERERRHR